MHDSAYYRNYGNGKKNNTNPRRKKSDNGSFEENIVGSSL